MGRGRLCGECAVDGEVVDRDATEEVGALLEDELELLCCACADVRRHGQVEYLLPVHIFGEDLVEQVPIC